MSRRNTALMKAALSALYYTGGHRMLAPFTQGVGAIFMLHQVSPMGPDAFNPNRILKVTPDFLEATVDQVLDAGFDVISLDEVHWRMTEGVFDRPFCAFTFDDGYRDNFRYAYPIFKKRDLPFTIYVPSDFAEGRAELWWLALEEVVGSVDRLQLRMEGGYRLFNTRTLEEKDRAYHAIYWWLRGIDEKEARGIVRELCRGIAYDPDETARDLLMNWDDLRAFCHDPIVTIGAHTVSHFALAKLSPAEAQHEMEVGARRIEQELGVRPRHFSYPYGSEQTAGEREFRIAKELGFKTAVTTRKGLIHGDHSKSLTALPRVSLNGDFQDQRYLSVMLSGAPFALYNAFSRKRAAA